MRLVLSLCAAIVLALTAAACGGSDDKKDAGGNQSSSSTSSSQAGTDAPKPSGGASNASLLNPCTLFTKEDATAAFGQPVKDGENKSLGSNPLGQKICFYGAVDDKSPSSVQLSVVQTAGMTEAVRKGGQSAKTLHDGTKSGMTGSTPAAGIGQDAFIASTSIYVLKGDTHFSILLFGNGRPGDPSHTNALKAAATKVVAKVP
jgi:hypothetical protein